MSCFSVLNAQLFPVLSAQQREGLGPIPQPSALYLCSTWGSRERKLRLSKQKLRSLLKQSCGPTQRRSQQGLAALLDPSPTSDICSLAQALTCTFHNILPKLLIDIIPGPPSTCPSEGFWKNLVTHWDLQGHPVYIHIPLQRLSVALTPLGVYLLSSLFPGQSRPWHFHPFLTLT